MTEIIEGTAVEIEPAEVRTVVVHQQPGQSLVARTDRASGPSEMVQVAAELASVLKDIVERQKLYATIQGKKYPQVEAWQTIARLDNVVAREVTGGILRLDDGSYEATVEIVRLSDGMVIGRGSALCGTQGDSPWDKRPEPARRSMAVTRATSRAFRQQYSWIMALAGYEPTPAEEMPTTPDASPARPSPARASAPVAAAPLGGDGGTYVLTGKAAKGNGNGMDMNLRETPDGHAYGFKLLELVGHPNGNKSTGVRVFGALALAASSQIEAGQEITVTGRLVPETLDLPSGKREYTVLVADSVEGPGFIVPAPGAAPEPPSTGKVDDLDSLPW